MDLVHDSCSTFGEECVVEGECTRCHDWTFVSIGWLIDEYEILAYSR